jgi:hypothetical protein
VLSEQFGHVARDASSILSILEEKTMFREILTALLPRQDRPTPKAYRRRRMTFESLETRAVPAALIDAGVAAEPITVTDAGDEVASVGMTLRQAIAEAQSTPEDDTIVFAEGISQINLSQGELLLGYLYMPPDSGALTIDGGAGADGGPAVTIDAGGQSGVMEIQSGTVILTGLTFTHGSSDLGGGLMIWDGTNVTLDNVHVTSNTASNAGGGIFSGGALTMTNTLVSNNYSRGDGGGVYIDGTYGGSLLATGSTFLNNEARSAGGGIYNAGGDVTLVGAIYNDGGSLDVSADSSFTDNQASGNGNDVYYTAGNDVSGIDGLDIFEAALKGKGGGGKGRK